MAWTRSAGVGLGLAIARENARLLHGGVTYRRSGGVTMFTATVPRDTEAAGDRPD